MEMGLSGVDFAVIVGYLVFVTLIGLIVSKKATGSIEEYFLGGNKLPWYLLGISGMATFIDMGGTAYQGGWYYLLGAKGFWLCVEGAMALLLSFQMIYIGKWLNRSGVMTNAEWMVFRFGGGKQGESARILSAVAALAICAGFMTFFFVGAGKVLTTFLPYFNDPKEIVPGISNQNLAALLFFILVGIYTIASGFYGVIYTDFVQAFLIMFLILFVAVKAFMVGTPEYFAKHATPEMLSLFPKDWNWSLDIPKKYAEFKGYVNKMHFLGLLIVFWIANNVFQGLATPFDTWTAQRYYAAKNEKEGSILCAFWIFLWSFRYLLLAGLGVLALGVASHISDPEKAMSVVIGEHIPMGIKGLLLAGLLAAGMSTMDSTVNSAGAYFVKDVYQRFLDPKAGARRLVLISYAITFLMFLIGAVAGWFVKDINSIWGWIIMGLFVGTLPPNILKWYWWRANGLSFTLGSITGLAAALAIQFERVAHAISVFFDACFPFLSGCETIEKYIFVFVAGFVGAIAGAFIAPPTNMETLKRFYLKTKPFGFWGPVRAQCDPEIVKEVKTESTRDMLLVFPAIVAQFTLFLMMSSIMWKDWKTVGICFSLFAVCAVVLYRFWYKNLRETAPVREVDLDLSA